MLLQIFIIANLVNNSRDFDVSDGYISEGEPDSATYTKACGFYSGLREISDWDRNLLNASNSVQGLISKNYYQTRFEISPWARPKANKCCAGVRSMQNQKEPALQQDKELCPRPKYQRILLVLISMFRDCDIGTVLFRVLLKQCSKISASISRGSVSRLELFFIVIIVLNGQI